MEMQKPKTSSSAGNGSGSYFLARIAAAVLADLRKVGAAGPFPFRHRGIGLPDRILDFDVRFHDFFSL
jgi:hypothetical protein